MATVNWGEPRKDRAREEAWLAWQDTLLLSSCPADGEAECTEVPRGPGDRRLSRKWRAT